MSKFFDVAFNLPTDRTFSYRLDSEEPCGVGYRVDVRFRNRKKVGYVVSGSDEKPEGDFSILPIDRVIDDAPIFDSHLLDLAKWMSTLYLCSVGEALSAMLPGAKRESALAADVELEEGAPRVLEMSDEQTEAVEGILAETAASPV